MNQVDSSRSRIRRAHRILQAVGWSAVLTLTLSCCSTGEAVTFDCVTVGDPGNANDATGYGGVGDAIGSAPIRIANNGRFKAVAGVAVANTVIVTNTVATYEHVLTGSDSLTNLAPVSNTITTADIVAGDSTSTTVSSKFNGDGSLTLDGLDGTRFLMVLDMDGVIPDDATTSTYYLGWWNAAANDNAGGWVNAVPGNHGTAGSLAGAYTMGYEQFLTSHGGWNGTTMLGAYGLDLARDQVWAVIDHNSDFGVTNNGILVVPEPSVMLPAIATLTDGTWWLRRRRRRAAGSVITGA